MVRPCALKGAAVPVAVWTAFEPTDCIGIDICEESTVSQAVEQCQSDQQANAMVPPLADAARRCRAPGMHDSLADEDDSGTMELSEFIMVVKRLLPQSSRGDEPWRADIEPIYEVRVDAATGARDLVTLWTADLS